MTTKTKPKKTRNKKEEFDELDEEQYVDEDLTRTEFYDRFMESISDLNEYDTY